MSNKIPIKNIYYMLCYAWDRLKEKDIIDADKIEGNDVLDLFARVMISGTEYLIKRGFDRKYINKNETIPIIKGKIDFAGSMKKTTWISGKMSCNYDELNHNILHNQIIKTTIELLIKNKDLDKTLKDDLVRLHRYFRDIVSIRVNQKTFSKIQINKNNQYYEFVLKVCEIIYNNILIDEQSGQTKFQDFYRDERQMAYLYENFVRNFYRREQDDFKVSRENIEWDVVGDATYLPRMQTDISLTSKDRKIVIDTKYYAEVFASNLGSEKFRSNNLYQIFAYLKNGEARGGINTQAEGMLLYPMVDDEVDADFLIQGHKIKIRTVNLNQDWILIHDRLMEIVQ